MTNNLYTRIETRDYDRRIYVDKYDDNEVWLSIQLNGGGANCVLSVDQAKDMIAALIRVVDAMEVKA
jgi:hypothetical protein